MFLQILIFLCAVLILNYRSIQQLELEKRAKDPMYKKKARERMKYLFEDGPWVRFKKPCLPFHIFSVMY